MKNETARLFLEILQQPELGVNDVTNFLAFLDLASLCQTASCTILDLLNSNKLLFNLDCSTHLAQYLSHFLLMNISFFSLLNLYLNVVLILCFYECDVQCSVEVNHCLAQCSISQQTCHNKSHITVGHFSTGYSDGFWDHILHMCGPLSNQCL